MQWIQLTEETIPKKTGWYICRGNKSRKVQDILFNPELDSMNRFTDQFYNDEVFYLDESTPTLPKEAVTVYIPVAVGKELPKEDNKYSVISIGEKCPVERIYLKGCGWAYVLLGDPLYDKDVTHWLKEEKLIPLTVEEYSGIMNEVERLKELLVEKGFNPETGEDFFGDIDFSIFKNPL